MAKNRYVNIGSVLKSKENEKEFYLKLSADAEFTVLDKDGELLETIKVKAGDSLSLQSPQARIAFLVENDHISEKEGEESLAKIPSFVKYNVQARVPLEQGGKKSSPAKRSKQDNDF